MVLTPAHKDQGLLSRDMLLNGRLLAFDGAFPRLDELAVAATTENMVRARARHIYKASVKIILYPRTILSTQIARVPPATASNSNEYSY